MKYMGSKNRIAKDILPIVLEARGEKCYIEPFVGGCNMIDKVKGRRIGADINPYLIELLKAIQNGWQPPENISEDEYNDIKNNKDIYDMCLVGFVGFNSTFGGKWFGGYARGKNSKNEHRNYTLEGRRNLLKQAPNLKDINFIPSSYYNLDIPDKSLIYCDPPYRNTTGYKDKFNHKVFYKWLELKKEEGHDLFLSEYSAPFNCVWEKEINCDLTKSNNKRVERLYKI